MGIKVLRDCDRVTITIGEVEFDLKPLNYWQKNEIMDLAEMEGGELKSNTRKATIFAMKSSIRDVRGLEDLHGNPYKVEFNEAGDLTDECVTDLLNLEMGGKILFACYNMVHGIPTEIVNPTTGKPLDGVTLKIKAPEVTEKK